MAEFDQAELDKHYQAIRDMGCAIIVLTPGDVQSAIGGDENDEPLLTIEQAADWLRDNQDDVEESVLGDYWGETISDLKSWTDRREAEQVQS